MRDLANWKGEAYAENAVSCLPMVEGLFGSVIFGRVMGRIMTFEDIDRRYKERYGAHMVHLRKPLLEWAGNDLVDIDMTVNLDGSWCGDPQPLLPQWHEYEPGAIAAPLIVGGRPMGPGLSLFVIEHLQEDHKDWLPSGQLIAVELRISFREYIPFADDASAFSSSGGPGFNTGAIPQTQSVAQSLGNISG